MYFVMFVLFLGHLQQNIHEFTITVAFMGIFTVLIICIMIVAFMGIFIVLF